MLSSSSKFRENEDNLGDPYEAYSEVGFSDSDEAYPKYGDGDICLALVAPSLNFSKLLIMFQT